MNILDRVVGTAESVVHAGRRRSRAFDHFCRAWLRYEDVLGGRLAAAIAYYGFFAVFALGLVAYSVFAFLLTYNVDLFEQVERFLEQNLPFLDVQAIQASRRAIGIVGLVGLALTGIGWMEAIRSSQRLIWELNQQPGNFLVRRLLDLAVLLGVLLLMALSVAAVGAVESLVARLIDDRVPILLTLLGWALTLALNMLLATALLAAVPRLRMTARRIAPPVLLVGVGVTLLNTIGRGFIAYVQDRPAYVLVGGAVGLLIYLYLFNQLLLFGAALAATSRHGRVVDLSGGPVPTLPEG